MSFPQRSAAVLKISDLREGYNTQIEFTIDIKQMDAFAELSGDCNPLHKNNEIAQARGFEGRVVYGALLVAQVSRMIGMELPGRDSLWSAIQLQFVAPLYPEQPAVLEAVVGHLSSATRSVELHLEIRAGVRLIARGKANVVIQDVT